MYPVQAPDLPNDSPLAPAVVLDTNVVLDWLLFRDPHCTGLAALLERRHLRWHATPAMRLELASVLVRPALQRWLPNCERILSTFDQLAHTGDSASDAAAGPVPLMRSRDPDDQKFIDLAVRVRARWLLSRDLALLRLARPAHVAGIEILTPARWQRLGGH
ncbi:MAG: putative toxin-antitoxin system toxin component, PIN family [Rhodospirillaceae bacterium]